MNDEEKGNSLEPEDIRSTATGSKLGTTKLPEAGPEDTNPAAPIATETPQSVEAIEEPVDADGSPSLSVDHEPPTDEVASSVGAKLVSAKKPQSLFGERPLPAIEMAPRILRYRTRRDVLLFGAGAIATVAGAGFLLPQTTLSRMGVRRNFNVRKKEWLLDKALHFDDDVADYPDQEQLQRRDARSGLYFEVASNSRWGVLRLDRFSRHRRS
jgi:hypothetical protein